MSPIPCIDRDNLQQYLAGWTDEASAVQIEQHLQTCPKCEKAYTDLELDPGSSLQPLPIKNLSVDVPEPDIANALLAAKQVIDSADEPEQLVNEIQLSSNQIGPYELLEPLGRGGMGAVYLARHRKLKKQVAIKLLPSTLRPTDAQSRFDREVLAAGQLQHPSIVAATDAGQANGLHYLVMEYVRGMDLGRLARLIGPLPVADVCEIGYQVALGLSHAHAAGMVHRDIKPSNVMLDESGAIKILDFGLVLLNRWDGAASELTTIGQFLGTLDYMAPEQAERCGAVDHRADLYALGATLFRLLCGRAPLAAAPNQSPIEKLRLLADHRPPSLRTLCPDAPQSLVELVDNLLATRPQDRPSSAAHVAERLSNLTEKADLNSLLEKARFNAKATKSESSLSVLPTQCPFPFVPIGRSHGRIRNRFRWLAAACVAVLLLAGVLVVLEFNKGQLVIDSDVADVHVKIVSNGQTVKELEIQTGNTTTRLRADKYEVQIDSPSDSVVIENEQFVLKNGQVVVARIRQKSSIHVIPHVSQSDAIAQDIPRTGSNSIIETGVSSPLYKAEPLSYWLAVLRLEKEPTAWLDAFKAVNILADSRFKSEVLNEVLRIAIDDDHIDSGEGATQVLWKLATWGNSTDLPTRLAFELDSHTLNKQLLLLNAIYYAKTLHKTPTSLWDPVWKWMDNKTKISSDQQLLLIIKRLVEIAFLNDPQSLVHLSKNFQTLARKHILVPMFSEPDSYANSISQSLRTGITSDPLKQQLVESLGRLKVVTIEDESLSFPERVIVADFLTQEDLRSDEIALRASKAIDQLLIIASADPSTLLSKVAYVPLNKTNRFPQPNADFASTASSRSAGLLLDVVLRMPLERRPEYGLRALTKATQANRDRAIEKMPGLTNSSFFLSAIRDPVRSQENHELAVVYAYHTWATNLLDRDIADPVQLSTVDSSGKFSREGLPPGAEDVWVKWCLTKLVSYDLTNDGIVTSPEWPASAGDFNSIDSNGNGSVSLAEYYTYRKGPNPK